MTLSAVLYICEPHLFKASGNLKWKCVPFLTSFSGTVFAISYGMILFVSTEKHESHNVHTTECRTLPKNAGWYKLLEYLLEVGLLKDMELDWNQAEINGWSDIDWEWLINCKSNHCHASRLGER